MSYPDALNHCCEESNGTHAHPATTNWQRVGRRALRCCGVVIALPFRSTNRCARWSSLPTGHTDVNYSFSGVVLLELQFQFLQRVELRLGDALPVEEERKEVNGCEDRVRTSATDGRHERWENNGYERVGKP